MQLGRLDTYKLIGGGVFLGEDWFFLLMRGVMGMILLNS